MKEKTQRLIALLLALILAFLFSACGKEGEASHGEEDKIWENATYLTDTELGEGEKTVLFEVKASERTVVFTVHTNQTTVGDALLENGLIGGDESQYGLYVKVVNGITADYDADKSYWAFYINGEYGMSGVDATEITEGTVYRLAYEK